MATDIKWVRAFSTADPIKCGLVRTMLEDHKIPTVIMNQQDSVYVSIGELQLLVPEAMSDDARLLILSLEDE